MNATSEQVHSGFTLEDDTGARVIVRKVRTRKGERLEVTSQRLGTNARLDAVALESITWQKSDVFEEMQAVPDVLDEAVSEPRVDETDDEIRIANEFAEVFASKATSDELELLSRRLDFAITLSVADLETVSYQDPDLYSEFLTYPFGPEH